MEARSQLLRGSCCGGCGSRRFAFHGRHRAQFRFRGAISCAHLGWFLPYGIHLAIQPCWEFDHRDSGSFGAEGALLTSALSLRFLREDHSRHAAHCADLSVLLHHRHSMGCREPRSCRYPYPFGIRWRLYCRDHPRRIRIASARSDRGRSSIRTFASTMRDLGRIAPDGLAYPPGTHRAICEHHKRFVAAFGDRSYRTYSDHARNQRYKLQFLRLLLAAWGALSLPHASHHVHQSLFREEDGLRRIAKKPVLLCGRVLRGKACTVAQTNLVQN